MDAGAEQSQPLALGRFTCNICGAGNQSSSDIIDRERATCRSCRSSIRFRSVILSLSRAFFGVDFALPDFPTLKSVRGLGLSDPEIYCKRLEKLFCYRNTFYHKEPRFDLVQPDESEFGQYDFVICSEVLEHVPPPVDRAFDTLARLLKPNGALILTAPYTFADATVEHFADLHESGLAVINDKTVLVSRSTDGRYEVFDQLAFHGGHGSTLEMRLFSETDLRAKLLAAGFTNLRFDSTGSPAFGVVYSGLYSLPIIAAKAPFSLGSTGIAELAQQLAATRKVLDMVRESRWIRLGRLFGVGPKIADRSRS